MSVYAIDITTIKTAYDTYVTAKAATVAANQAIIDAGSEPTYPQVVTTNNSWNSVTTSRNTWVTNNSTLKATLKTCQDTQRTAEVAVITTLGYGSGATSGICCDEWVTVVGAGGGILTYTNYIGFANNTSELKVSLTLPTQNFPNT